MVKTFKKLGFDSIKVVENFFKFLIGIKFALFYEKKL